MIDWDQPIRLVKTKRQVYVVGDRGGWSTREIGVDNRWGSGGIYFYNNGKPAGGDAPPGWEEIENFQPLADMISGWVDVDPPKGADEALLNAEDWEDVRTPADLHRRTKEASKRLKEAREQRRLRMQQEAAQAAAEASWEGNDLFGSF